MRPAEKPRRAVVHPPCRRCRHFFVTWDPAAPNGCRAVGFKTRHIPSQVVYASSGLPCQSFRPKKLRS